MYTAHLVGVYEDGTGFGNMSIRFEKNKFIITGATTGRLNKLTAEHYTFITEYDIDKNSLTCEGPIKASSESLTHAMIYKCDEEIKAVFHVHHQALWKKLMNVVPTTDAAIEYGTSEMAKEMSRLFKETNLLQQKILVMAGHEEGIITFGKTMEEAGEKILSELSLLK